MWIGEHRERRRTSAPPEDRSIRMPRTIARSSRRYFALARRAELVTAAGRGRRRRSGAGAGAEQLHGRQPVARAERQGLARSRLKFPKGSRSNWHSHSWGQLLMVEQGHGLTQERGGALRIVAPGPALVHQGRHRTLARRRARRGHAAADDLRGRREVARAGARRAVPRRRRSLTSGARRPFNAEFRRQPHIHSSRGRWDTYAS